MTFADSPYTDELPDVGDADMSLSCRWPDMDIPMWQVFTGTRLLQPAIIATLEIEIADLTGCLDAAL